MKPLASTTFAGGVNESLAAVDVHVATGQIFSGVSESQIIGFNVSSMSSLLSENVNTLLPTQTGIVGAPSLSNPSSIIAAASSFSTQAAGALKNAPADIQSALTQTSGAVSSVTTQIAGITSVINNVKQAGVGTLFETLSGVASPEIAMGLQDVASSVTLGTNLVKQAASGGVGGVFTALASTPQFQGNPIQEITRAALPAITLAGNVKALAEVGRQQGPAIISAALAPTLGMDVLANYKDVKNQVAQARTSLQGEWGAMKGAVTALQSDFLSAKKNLTRDVAQAKTMLSSKNLTKASKDAVKAIQVEVAASTQLSTVRLLSKTPQELAQALTQKPEAIAETFILPTMIKPPALNLPILKGAFV